MSFWQYISNGKVPDTPVGDFMQDARQDLSFPRRVGSWRTLKRYLKDHSACDAAIEAARECWDEYKRAGDRLTPGPV